jgi:hypothetical protein
VSGLIVARRQDGAGLCSIIASDGAGLCSIIASDGAGLCSIIASDGDWLCSIIASDGDAEKPGDGDAPGAVHATSAAAVPSKIARRPAGPAERERTMVGLRCYGIVTTTFLDPGDIAMTVL